MLADTCSKAEELDHWRAFLAQLPPFSYLAMYFRDSVPLLENAMRNDWGCEPIVAIRSMRLEALGDEAAATKQAAAAKERRDKLQAEVKLAKRELADCREQLRKLAESANTLARNAAEAQARCAAVLLDDSLRN